MKRILPAHELMSQAMSEQIDRIVEQQRERKRKEIHKDQRGLEQWIN